MTKKVIQSYVFHGDSAFFVSTINRTSSCMEGGTFAETMVWEWDASTRKQGEFVWQGEGSTGSVHTHFLVCKRLIDTGLAEAPESDK